MNLLSRNSEVSGIFVRTFKLNVCVVTLTLKLIVIVYLLLNMIAQML